MLIMKMVYDNEIFCDLPLIGGRNNQISVRIRTNYLMYIYFKSIKPVMVWYITTEQD